MTEFDRMTVVAATEVVSAFHSHDEMAVLEVEWDVAGRFGAGSKSARVAGLAKIAIEENPEVMSVSGRISLARAIIEKAVRAPITARSSESWKKLVAGLRFDGFEIVENSIDLPPKYSWGLSTKETAVELRRMLPDEIPGADFREAESELEMLLDRHEFVVAKGHLQRAISAFGRGEWSSANGELRNFYENYLNEIANQLGYAGSDNSKAKRDFLGGGTNPPFLLADYNEWDAQKTQYVQALMNRLHPHGGHPGLSEEEDAAFRLQITLVTARLFIRRFDRRGT